MISTSNKWKEYSKDIGVFHIKATIDNGTSMALTDADFMEGSVSITDSVSDMSEFTVGSVITNSFSATLNNFGGKFENYKLAGATISVQFGIVYADSTEEWINRGIYTIEKPTSLGYTIQITAYDRMDKMNKFFDNKHKAGSNLYSKSGNTNDYIMDSVGDVASPEPEPGSFYSDYISVTPGNTYETNGWKREYHSAIFFFDSSKQFVDLKVMTTCDVKIPSGVSYVIFNGYIADEDTYFFRNITGSSSVDIPYPISHSTLATYLCKACGMPYDADFWKLDDYDVDAFEINQSTTCRQVLGWLTQMTGGYARVNGLGKLECKPFKRTDWADGTSMDGGTIDPWEWEYLIEWDGGTINPWSVVIDKDGGSMSGVDFMLSKIQSLNVYIEDIEITGVTAYHYNTIEDFFSATYGDDGYIIPIQDNPMIMNDASGVAERVGEQLIGIKFRPFDAAIFGDPCIEAGDAIILQDYVGRKHKSLITSLTYSLNNTENLECNAKSPEENAADIASYETSQTQKAIEATKNNFAQNGINMNDESVISPEGDAVFTGSVTASSFINSSKKEIKQDITKAESALSKVANADIMSFKYKDSDDRKHLGLVIGEEYNTPSEVVADGGVDLYAMVSMSWKAIQELTEEIESLKKEIANGNTDQTRK